MRPAALFAVFLAVTAAAFAVGAPPAAAHRPAAHRPGAHRPPALRQLGIPPLHKLRLRPVFRTGFERDSDLAGFYVTPQSPLTRHEIRSSGAHRGRRAHVAWLTGATGQEPV